MGATAKRMRRGVVLALGAVLSNMCVVAAMAAATAESHRLYDRQTDCAVFDTAAFPAVKATWDGPCTHGLASGRGTATFVGLGGASETISSEFRDGIVVDGKADIAWSGGAHFSGATMDGRPNGAGALVDAKGNRFDGEWKDGALNGHGSVVWTNGDRYEGEWVAGKAEGHGVQLWAGGQKYDGQWHNDQPNGQGTLTHKDGTSVAGTFVDGKRQVADAAAAPPAPPAAPSISREPVADTPLLDHLAGRTLIAVDGSRIAFTAREGAVVRTMTAPDGTVQTAAFLFLGKGLGTVTDAGDPPQVSGVFRTTSTGVEAEFSDGHVETLAPLDDGVGITMKSATGDQVCAAWYPQGHVFSAEERKAAVAAYARRLGLADAAPAAVRPSCTTQAAAPVADRHAGRSPVTPRHKPGPAAALAPAPVNGLQTVPVKLSTVHLIDGATAPDSIETATAATTATSDEAVASNCLKVDSDGAYWGFRNHCGYAVQFAYCLLRGEDRMTACAANGAVSVQGSVSASGFSALFSDDSLGEREVEHNFRWVGCKGGAGEVAAHLDAAEPASGHCERAGRTLAQGN